MASDTLRMRSVSFTMPCRPSALRLSDRISRYARVGKAKAAKRDAKAEERFYLENRNYAEQVYAKTQRSRFLTQVAFLCAARDVFHFGQKRLFALLQKAAP